MNDDVNPSYSLSASVNRPVVSPGDQVRIDFYFYGGGQVDDHKFEVQIPPEIIDGPVQVTTFKFITFPETGLSQPFCPPQVDSLNHRFSIYFNPHYFTKLPDHNSLYSEEYVTCGDKTYAPASVSFIISKSASSGDHLVSSKFVYIGKKQVQIAEASTVIHIKSYGERNQNLLTGSLTVLLFLAPILVAKMPNKYRLWIIATTVALGCILLILLGK